MHTTTICEFTNQGMYVRILIVALLLTLFVGKQLTCYASSGELIAISAISNDDCEVSDNSRQSAFINPFLPSVRHLSSSSMPSFGRGMLGKLYYYVIRLPELRKLSLADAALAPAQSFVSVEPRWLLTRTLLL